MGPLQVHLNGAASGETFVIVSTPSQPLPAALTLQTSDGSECDVACRPSQGSAAALSFDPSTVHLSGQAVEVQVLASTPSESRNDSTIEIVRGSDVLAQFDLTAIAQPRVRFAGRFQCRLATDSDDFDHHWGTQASFFRMYAVQGANPLDPAAPTDEPPLDRIIRFQDGVALRPLCSPIGVTVTGIEAEVGGSRLLFATGDPLLGLPVRLGPQSRFEEQDGAFAVSTLQPIADFRLELGTSFAGSSEPALERHDPDPNVPPPSKAPYADGAFSLDAIGPWQPSDFGYPEPTWVAHAQALIAKKLADLQADESADERAERIRLRRIAEHQAFANRMIGPLSSVQRYTGEIDRDLHIPGQPVGVLAYLAALPSIPFYAEFFDFDTDCHCGTVTGTLGLRATEEAAPAAARLSLTEARGARAGVHPP